MRGEGRRSTGKTGWEVRYNKGRQGKERGREGEETSRLTVISKSRRNSASMAYDHGHFFEFTICTLIRILATNYTRPTSPFDHLELQCRLWAPWHDLVTLYGPWC